MRACNRVGIVVDLAHASHETVVGALAIATRPLIISHTNLDTWTGHDARMAEMMRPRLISADHARAVADAGGVIGIWTKLTTSVEEYVESVRAMVDAIGVDHVGIGTDTDLLSSREGQGTNEPWAGTSGFLVVVTDEMARQGLAADEIGKIVGGNYRRVFAAATGTM